MHLRDLLFRCGPKHAPGVLCRPASRINKQPHPGNSRSFCGTSQCGRNLPAFIESPVKRSAEPFQWGAPVEVAMEATFKKDQVRYLLLIAGIGRANEGIDHDSPYSPQPRLLGK